MKVDFSANINLYRKNAAGGQKTARGETGKGKTDVVEFTRGATTTPDKGMAALKASVLSDVGRNAEAERLNQLSQSVKDGAYRVSTEDLVDAILGS